MLHPKVMSPRFEMMAMREPEHKYAESPARLKDAKGTKFKRELRSAFCCDIFSLLITSWRYNLLCWILSFPILSSLPLVEQAASRVRVQIGCAVRARLWRHISVLGETLGELVPRSWDLQLLELLAGCRGDELGNMRLRAVLGMIGLMVEGQHAQQQPH
eukprot:g7253.t1